DDNEMMRQSVTAALEREEYQVMAFRDASVALTAMGHAGAPGFDVIVSDLKMPGIDGIEFLRQLRERQLETPLILMTAVATVPTAVSAMKMGAFDYLQKPFEADELIVLIDRAIQVSRLRNENDALRTSLSDWQRPIELVGSGSAMREVREQIAKVAASS